MAILICVEYELQMISFVDLALAKGNRYNINGVVILLSRLVGEWSFTLE